MNCRQAYMFHYNTIIANLHNHTFHYDVITANQHACIDRYYSAGKVPPEQPTLIVTPPPLDRKARSQLSMHHCLERSIHRWAQGLRKADEHRAYIPHAWYVGHRRRGAPRLDESWVQEGCPGIVCDEPMLSTMGYTHYARVSHSRQWCYYNVFTQGHRRSVCVGV